MDMKNWSGKAAQVIKKYRYAIFVLVIGIFLMLLPSYTGRQSGNESTQPVQKSESYTDITGELTEVLSSIQGVGNVRVMLTVSTGEQTIYQVDENISSTETGSSIQKETVIITGTDRREEALISYIKPPTYLGAIIVCQGADQASVKLAIVDAVSKITGLSSDKISVVKMK